MKNTGRQTSYLRAHRPAVQAVTIDGRVVTVADPSTYAVARRSTAERILLYTDLAHSAYASLAFRGLLLVAIAVMVIALWI